MIDKSIGKSSPSDVITKALLQMSFCMRDFSKNLTYRCAILRYHFSYLLWNFPHIQPPYAIINTIYCGIGYSNKEYWSSDIPKMVPPIYTCVFFVLTVLLLVHTVCNLCSYTTFCEIEQSFKIASTSNAQLAQDWTLLGMKIWKFMTCK